ncbi:C4-type zinc finger protein YbiI, partial [Escherichia coli]|nr:C4-type zinc finger protein YbiI [Escherichia coli]
CEECGAPIPQARREAIPGVRLCIHCQQEKDLQKPDYTGYNRRGSKDSQLR